MKAIVNADPDGTLPPTGAMARRLDIDNLRNIAVLLLIVFHTARLFDVDPWHIKDAHTYAAADWIIMVMNQWHMPVLFMLAGASAGFAFRRRSARAFLQERVLRLLIPVLFGFFLIVLPQVYLERISPDVPNRMSPIDFSGGLAAFLPRFLECCYPAANFSWHHLWFIVYLFVYSVVLVPVFLLFSRAPVGPWVERFAATLSSMPRLLALGLPILAVETFLRPAFPSTHNLIHDWANHAHFVTLIILGWLIYASAPAQSLLVQHRRSLLLVALAVTTVYLLGDAEVAIAGWVPTRDMFLTARTAGEWLWILTFISFARRYLDRPIPGLTPFTRYAFPFYILHQTLIVWLGWLLFAWSGAPLAKYLAVAAAAAALSLLLCRAIDQTAAGRFVFGMRSRRARRQTVPG